MVPRIVAIALVAILSTAPMPFMSSDAAAQEEPSPEQGNAPPAPPTPARDCTERSQPPPGASESPSSSGANESTAAESGQNGTDGTNETDIVWATPDDPVFGAPTDIPGGRLRIADVDANFTIPGEYIVGFYCVPRGIQAGQHLQGALVKSVDHELRSVLVEVQNENAFYASFDDNPRVRFIVPHSTGIRTGAPNDPDYPLLDGMVMIRAPEAWDTTVAPGNSKKACIVDDGVNRFHEDLIGNYGGGFDLINSDTDPHDTGANHGTQMAGIVAGVINNGKGVSGVGNMAFLVVRGVLSDNHFSSSISWCKANGGNVMLLALESPNPLPNTETAINLAWNEGHIVVVAAGNTKTVNCGTNNCVQYPARYNNAIAVGCVSIQRVMCSDTSRGPEIDIAAPGSKTRTTDSTSNNAYVTLSVDGTSPASAHVAGAIAFAWSQFPTKTNAFVRSVAQTNSQPLVNVPSYGKGHGLIDVKGLLVGLAGTGSWARNQGSSCATSTDQLYECDVTTSSFRWFRPTTMTTVSLGGEQVSGAISFPALYGVAQGLTGTFPHYGINYQQFYIGSNGVVCFTAQLCNDSTPTTIPVAPASASTEGAPMAACLWADLSPTRGRISYGWVPDIDSPLRDVMVIQFFGVPFNGNWGAVTFQVQLFSDGEIKCMYQTISPDPGTSVEVAGMQAPLGASGLRYYAAAGRRGYENTVSFVPLVKQTVGEI